jgi:outer membrane protein TolC
VIGLWALALMGVAAAERPVSYADALASAGENNPAVLGARYSASEAEAGWRAANGIYDPNYELGSTWTRSTSRGFFQGFPYESQSTQWSLDNGVNGSLPTGTSYGLDTSLDRNFAEYKTDFGGLSDETLQDSWAANMSFTVTQQLLRGIRMQYNLQNVTLARRGMEVAGLTAEKARQDTLAAAAAAYWDWAYRVTLREIGHDSVEVAEEALRVGQLKVEVGELAPVEQTRLEAALVQAQAAALDAEQLELSARDTVLLLMGEDPGQDVMPSTPPGEVVDLELDAKQVVEVALAQNLDVAVAKANLENARLREKNANHGRLPSLAAVASLGVNSQVEDDATAGAAIGALATDPLPWVSMGGTFQVPLGNRAARGTADQAKFVVFREETSVIQAERDVASRAGQQVTALQAGRRRTELADANLRLAEETLAAEEALADVGRAIQKDVLEARTEVDRARAESAKARTDYRQAQVELLRLQGTLTEEVP